MISTYFVHQESLDNLDGNCNDIDANILLNESRGDRWYLKSHPNANWVWRDDIFDTSELLRLKRMGDLMNVMRAETGSHGTDCLDHRRSMISWVNINSETEWIYRKMTDAVNQVNDAWFKYDLTDMERLQYTRYYSNESGFYKSHIDPIGTSDPFDRKLSFVVQLSNSWDYKGGDLLLHLGHEPVCIPKELGYTVFFPSHTLHEVTPVTYGVRQTLVGWVYGPKLR